MYAAATRVRGCNISMPLSKIKLGGLSTELSRFTKVICRNCKSYVGCSIDSFADLKVEEGVAPRKFVGKFYLTCHKKNARLALPGVTEDNIWDMVVDGDDQCDSGGS